MFPGLLLVGACGGARGEREPLARERGSSTQVITAEEIEESGATTAWDALRILAPHLRTSEKNGRPTRLQRRGPASIVLSDPPLVYVDGVRMADYRDLALVPATTVESIAILSLADGATYYGTNAVGGVIVIKTKHS
jgi:outer membrane cobalamin receptor